MSERINNSRKFDILGDILETLRFRGTIFFQSSLAAPWGMKLDVAKFPRFHIALSGGFYVGTDNVESPTEVHEMDIIMIPRGGAHWIADQPGRMLVPSSEASEACQLGKPMFQSGKITNSVMCGQIHYDNQTSHPLFDALPSIVHVPKIDHASSIWRLIELIDNEIKQQDKLGGPIVDRLTEVLFLKLLYKFIGESDTDTGFITALRDRRLATALRLIHERLDEPWTIDRLANQVGMSRATLVRKFRDAVGIAPIDYLTQWRLLKTHTLVKYSSDPIEKIAERVGFASAQTLAKSFKRHYGFSPSSLRR